MGLLGAIGNRGRIPVVLGSIVRLCRKARLRPDYFAIAICLISSNAAAESPEVTPVDLAKPYAERQAFKGKAYFKDNNVWIYTQAFAETFGMPPENVYPQLEGIEAAAFRVEGSGFQNCGYGGKEENCKEHYRCITDIYIDETRYPLPWATLEIADWFSDYNSLQWLEVPRDRGRYPNAVPGTLRNSMSGFWASLHPFADPQTHEEVFIGHNGNVPIGYEENFGGIPIYGFKRKAIAGLSLVSLRYTCMERNREKSAVTFSFRSISVDKDGRSTTLKKFHEFVLPNVFERKIDQKLQSWFARDREFYKKLLNIK